MQCEHIESFFKVLHGKTNIISLTIMHNSEVKIEYLGSMGEYRSPKLLPVKKMLTV